MPNPTPPAIKSTVPYVFQFCFLISIGNGDRKLPGGGVWWLSGEGFWNAIRSRTIE